ncbi:PspC domain-containing protein [Bailinhaonella thermotolerans]|nr:PspC domain-containing protein [Bailinhaonella thermotolerans]
MDEMNDSQVKQLRRTRDGRIIAGVCSGAGRYVGIDPNIIRIALAALTLFGGAGIAIYALAWLIVPEEGRPTSIAQDLIDKNVNKNRPTP